ncbi:MAG: pilus assembly protein PilP [Deltaproteobacteria bacterium]
MICLLVGGTGEKGAPFGKMTLLHAAAPSTPPAVLPVAPGAKPPVAAPSTPPAVLPVAPGAKPVTAAAAPPPTLDYRYNAAGKADPFKPYMETDPVAKKKLEEEEQKKKLGLKERPVSPLQQADIGQFRLVGIVGDQNRRVAMVEDGAAKKFYPLFTGTWIGQNGGRVAAILPDRVVVEEKGEKQEKKAQVRRVTVMLHKEEEGKP